MINLYIDFDGVILDTINSTYRMIDELGISEDPEKVKTFYAELNWKQLLEDSPIINNAFDCIEKIIESNKFNVAILTHVISLEEAIQKVKYIRKYFDDITIIPVPKAISKTKMVHTKGAILIDDYSGNLREWENEGGVGVRFSSKLNGKGFLVIDKLDQIIDINLEKIG